MEQLKSLQPYLGETVSFTINSSDPEVSLKFYQKLGFKELMRSDFPFNFIQVSDGAILIMLRKSPEPYFALTYYLKDPSKIIPELESKGVKFISKPKSCDFIKRYLFKSLDGLNISLVEMAELFPRPAGKTMLDMEQSDYFKPDTYTNKTAGMFGELAQPVNDLERSIEFWQILGFTVVSKFTSPYPWAILSDGLSIAGLHQTTQFTQPAITFFAADMKDKIENLKKDGLTPGGSPVNGILTTPEQQKIFLYKL